MSQIDFKAKISEQKPRCFQSKAHGLPGCCLFKYKDIILSLLLMLFFSTGMSVFSNDIVINKPSQASIIISRTPSKTERFAAKELSKYIKMMTGVDIPVHKEGEKTDGILFLIGRCKANEKYLAKFGQSISGPGPDSFLIKAKGNKIILVGGGDRGTLYSVYAFLDKQGCRWFIPGPLGEVIPKKEKLVIKESEKLEVPDFIQREIQGLYMHVSQDEKLAWMARNRINRENDYAIRIKRNDERLSKRGGFLNWYRLFHNIPFIIPPRKYFKEHPEYYSLYKGKRIPAGYRQGNVCTTNPKVLDYFVEYINRWFKNNKDGSVFPIWPADGDIRWCECKECKKLGGRNFFPDTGAMSRRLVTFVNEIAKRVQKTHPDRLILLCAYHPNYLDPVEDMKLEKNVIVQVIHDGCHAHATNKCSLNEEEKKRLEGWAKMANPKTGSPGYSEIPMLAWSEYARSPLPVAKRIRDNLKYLRSIGSKYYYAQTGIVGKKETKTYDMICYSPFPFYVITKYTWDVNTDYDALCKDFFNKFYGRAGGEMNKYWNLFENAVQNSDWHPSPWTEMAIPSAKVYNLKLLIEAEKHLKKAEQLAENDMVKKRLAFIRESFDFLKKAVGTRTVFTVKKGKKFYTLNNGEKIFGYKEFGDTENIAAERSKFRNQEIKFPVINLENNRLLLSIIPGMGGRIAKLYDKKTKTDFMFSPEGETVVFKINAFYLNYGGYEELIGKSFPGLGWEMPYKYKIYKSGGEKKIILKRKFGGVLLTRVIGLGKGDSAEVNISTTVSNLLKKKMDVRLIVHPVMAINKNLSNHYVFSFLKDGKISKNNISLELKNQPFGSWAVVDGKADVGVANFFDPSQAKAKVHVDHKQKSFNMELKTTEHVLKPNTSFTFAHSYRVMDKASEELKAVLQQK